MFRGHILVHSDLFWVERSVCWFRKSDVEHSRDKEGWVENKGWVLKGIPGKEASQAVLIGMKQKIS